jgi:large subunit ribosomal protein L10
MDNPRPAKVSAVTEVRSRLDRADAVIVTEYRGLKVKDLAALRRSLAPLGGEYRIYKNTLARIAAGDRGHDGFEELLIGPTALTFVQGDAAAVTKLLRDFARANPMLVIKGGLLGKSVLGPSATVALADLPSRQVLLARVAGALAAPMQIMAGLLAAVPRNFAYGLSALRDKLAAGEPQPEAAQPEAAHAEPEAAEPETAQPDAAQPEAAHAEPEAAQPEAAEPEAVEAGAVEAEAAQPEAAEPEAAQDVAAQPEAVEAEEAPPEADQVAEAEPEAAEVQAAQVEAAPPEAAQDVAAQPEAVEAEAAQAEAAQAEVAKPEETEPEES